MSHRWGWKEFQSTLPCGSDASPSFRARSMGYFNPRSLAGATRENPLAIILLLFQSTLPCGSDSLQAMGYTMRPHFNPRSLAGATVMADIKARRIISIHAPLRERPNSSSKAAAWLLFQSTLPCGSDIKPAPVSTSAPEFQSTLPCGSDCVEQH